MSKRVLATYSIGHLLVDLASAFVVIRCIGGSADSLLSILLYNFCAFALQMPFGALADRYHLTTTLGGAGCSVIAAAYVLNGMVPHMLPLIAIVTGIGNGLYHVGIGREVMRHSLQKCYLLGIFIAPGALGVYWGTTLGNSSLSLVIGFMLMLGLGLLIISTRTRSAEPHNDGVSAADWDMKPVSAADWDMKPVSAAVCFFAVVAARSFFGFCADFPWRTSWYGSFILLGGVFLGKALGGFLADRCGMMRTATASLLLAAILLPFASPLTGVIAMLLVNMTTPITLWALAKILPQNLGLAFGVLTFALFIGYLASLFNTGIKVDLSVVLLAAGVMTFVAFNSAAKDALTL